MESTRVIMLRNWHFDILNMEHWQIAWDLWLNSWVISEPKEWAFVLIIVSFIPLWFTGWIALSLISWGKVVWFILTLPWKLFKNFFYKPVKIITTNTGVTPIRRRKSYKEIRPRALRPVINDRMEVASPAAAPIVIPTITPSARKSAATRSVPEPETAPRSFEHALFKFDDSFDDLNFDIDSFEVEPKAERAPEPAPRRRDFDDGNANTSQHRERNERSSERRERDARRSDDRKNDSNNSGFQQDERSRSADTGNDRRRNEERKNRDDSERRRNEDRKSRSESNDRRRSDDRKEHTENNQTGKSEAAATPVPARQNGGSCLDIIKQKGYEVISRVSIKNTVIDFIGVSNDKICLCMLDREPGDWLADEERFNDEEPLWFSENSHRISPVRKIDLAKKQLISKLEENNFDYRVEAFLIIQIGNIINADDMFEIWEDMDINVTRIDRGTPREIKLFARTLPEAEKRITDGKLDKLMKIIRNMG